MTKQVKKIIEKHYNEILGEYKSIIEAMKIKGNDKYVSYIWGYISGKIEILYQFEEISTDQLINITKIYEVLQATVPKYLKVNA